MSAPGLHGIVSHPPVREACIPFVEMAAGRGGLCNVHMHDALFGEVTLMFPAATFITHHWGVLPLGDQFRELRSGHHADPARSGVAA